MRKRSISSPAVVASIALMTGVLITSAAVAQIDQAVVGRFPALTLPCCLIRFRD